MVDTGIKATPLGGDSLAVGGNFLLGHRFVVNESFTEESVRIVFEMRLGHRCMKRSGKELLKIIKRSDYKIVEQLNEACI